MGLGTTRWQAAEWQHYCVASAGAGAAAVLRQQTMPDWNFGGLPVSRALAPVEVLAPLYCLVNEVPHTVAKIKTALFEFCTWPFASIVRNQREVIRCSHLLLHVFCVILPVGSHVQDGVVHQLAVNGVEKLLLYDTPLVVAFFVPGIWKK